MIRLAAHLAAATIALASPAAAGDGADPALAVISQESGTVARIDVARQVVSQTIGVGKSPAGIAAAPDGERLYVTYPDGKAIGIVGTGAKPLVRSLPFDGEPFGIAAGRHVLFVSDWAKGTLVEIDADDGRVIATAKVGGSPAGVVADLSARRLYVADREDDDVAVVDMAAMRVIAKIRVGTAPFALALSAASHRLYVADVRSNDVTIVDTGTLARVATVPVGSMPYGVALTPNGTIALATNQHNGNVSIIDTRMLSVVGTIDVGRYPEGIICRGNDRAYVANWFSNDVSVIDIAARREVRRIKVGDGPRGFAASDPDPDRAR